MYKLQACAGSKNFVNSFDLFFQIQEKYLKKIEKLKINVSARVASLNDLSFPYPVPSEIKNACHDYQFNKLLCPLNANAAANQIYQNDTILLKNLKALRQYNIYQIHAEMSITGFLASAIPDNELVKMSIPITGIFTDGSEKLLGSVDLVQLEILSDQHKSVVNHKFMASEKINRKHDFSCLDRKLLKIKSLIDYSQLENFQFPEFHPKLQELNQNLQIQDFSTNRIKFESISELENLGYGLKKFKKLSFLVKESKQRLSFGNVGVKFEMTNDLSPAKDQAAARSIAAKTLEANLGSTCRENASLENCFFENLMEISENFVLRRYHFKILVPDAVSAQFSGKICLSFKSAKRRAYGKICLPLKNFQVLNVAVKEVDKFLLSTESKSQKKVQKTKTNSKSLKLSSQTRRKRWQYDLNFINSEQLDKYLNSSKISKFYFSLLWILATIK